MSELIGLTVKVFHSSKHSSTRAHPRGLGSGKEFHTHGVIPQTPGVEVGGGGEGHWGEVVGVEVSERMMGAVMRKREVELALESFG